MGRVYVEPDTDFLKLGEGDYGQEADGSWSVRPPGQHVGSVRDHTVTEHDDGTITVSPSIRLPNLKGDGDAWHGYLERGEWREV